MLTLHCLLDLFTQLANQISKVMVSDLSGSSNLTKTNLSEKQLSEPFFTLCAFLLLILLTSLLELSTPKLQVFFNVNKL